MGIFNNFPYTNFHELNLDWMIEKIKTFETAMTTFQSEWATRKLTFEGWQTTFATMQTEFAAIKAEWTTQKAAINAEWATQKAGIASDWTTQKAAYQAQIDAAIDDMQETMQAQYDEFLENYQRQFGIVQVTGTSTTDAMSQNAISSILNDVVADEYSSSSTYAIGDCCLNSGKLYKCIEAITTAETWTAGHWIEIQIENQIEELDDLVKTTTSNIDITDQLTKTTGERWVTTTSAIGSAVFTSDSRAYWSRTNFISCAPGEKFYFTRLTSYESDTACIAFANNGVLVGVLYRGTGTATAIYNATITIPDGVNQIAFQTIDNFSGTIYKIAYDKTVSIKTFNEKFTPSISTLTSYSFGKNYNNTSSIYDNLMCAMNGKNFKEMAYTYRAKLYSGRFSHDSTLVVDENGIGYIAYVCNNVTTGDSPTDVNAFVQLATVDLTTLTTSSTIINYPVAKHGDSVFGLTISSGVGVPNAIYKDGVVYVLFSAKCSDNNYYMMMRAFDTETLTFGAVQKCTFIKDGTTYDFTTSNISNHITTLPTTDYFISMNAQIGINSSTYYCGVCVSDYINSGIIFTTTDAKNFTFWMQPSITDSNANFECACCILNGSLYYAIRQKTTAQNMIVAKIDISTKTITEYVKMPDVGSRACFILNGTNLYLFHSTNERRYSAILKIDTSNLLKSYIINETLDGYSYASAVIYNNTLYFSSTDQAGVAVYIRKGEIAKYNENDAAVKIYRIIESFTAT